MKNVDAPDDPGRGLATEGGITDRLSDRRDPYETLDDLMAAVEALCPSWPPREVFRAGGDWRL